MAERANNAGQPKEKRLSARVMLRGLEVGESVVFPIERLNSIRTLASEARVITRRGFATKTDRAARTITVTRTA